MMRSSIAFCALVLTALPVYSQTRDVTITAIPGVIGADAKWQEVWKGTNNADGIVGTPEGGLLFAQEQPSTIRKLDENDKDSIYVSATHGAGAVAIDSKGRILVVQRTCTDPGRGNAPCNEPTTVAVIFPENEGKILTDNYQGKSLGRLNDLVVDRKGTVYFTVGSAYYLNPGGKVTSLGDNIRSNGIMLSPDETTLYVTNGQSILAFDIQPDGTVANRRDFAKLQGVNGDGMAIDAAGRLYVTTAPGVQVFGPDGELSRHDSNTPKRDQRRLCRPRQEDAIRCWKRRPRTGRQRHYDGSRRAQQCEDDFQDSNAGARLLRPRQVNQNVT
jgi:gluconolactonase